MKLFHRILAIASIGAAMLSLGTIHSKAEWDGPVMGAIEGGEEFWLATDAYIYGYPLVTMEMTRRVITNVAAPEGTHAPMGQLIKLREYPDASFKDVTAPNADTLYTTAFIDVGKEPWVISVPDMKDRYYLLPMLDGWTNVFQVPGKRTTGTGAQTYAITGPGWQGSSYKNRRASNALHRSVKPAHRLQTDVWVRSLNNLRHYPFYRAQARCLSYSASTAGRGLQRTWDG